MSERGAGSDVARIRTTARREGDEYVIDGAKTFITNGQNADLVITAVKTDPAQRHKGISLIAVEADRPGFSRGRKLPKVGQHAADTSGACRCTAATGTCCGVPGRTRVGRQPHPDDLRRHDRGHEGDHRTVTRPVIRVPRCRSAMAREAIASAKQDSNAG